MKNMYEFNEVVRKMRFFFQEAKGLKPSRLMFAPPKIVRSAVMKVQVIPALVRIRNMRWSMGIISPAIIILRK